MTGRPFTCALCGSDFVSDWTEEEAEAEAVTRFGNSYTRDTRESVCDDCYNEIVQALPQKDTIEHWSEADTPGQQLIQRLIVAFGKDHPGFWETDYGKRVLEYLYDDDLQRTLLYKALREAKWGNSSGMRVRRNKS